jgi:hypothetical protein
LIITLIIPLSLICTMFILTFCAKTGDMDTRFQLEPALKAAFQPIYLIMCFISLITAFLFSFKKTRLIKVLRRR